MFPVHVPLASALLGALLPERGVVGDHGGHEVVGGLLPRRGPAQGVRVQVARVAVVLQHRHCIYYLHISTCGYRPAWPASVPRATRVSAAGSGQGPCHRGERGPAGPGVAWHHHHYNNYSFKRISTQRFVIMGKATTRSFSWLKLATSAFAFKTLLRHYAKQALTHGE